MRSAIAIVLSAAALLAACAPAVTDRPVTSEGTQEMPSMAPSSPMAAEEPTDAPSATPAAAPGTDDPLLVYELVDVRTGEAFTLGTLAAEKPVLVETMAIWCTTCRAQQREVVAAHEHADFHSVGVDVDPNERAEDLAEYAERERFDWRFAMADSELVRLLTERYGFAVTNPPSTPTFVATSEGIRALEFGRVRSADELVAELARD